MDEIQQIVEGWKNVFFPNPVSEELAKKRLASCVSCVHYKPSPMRKCGICHCWIPAVVRSSKKKCPKGRW